MVFLPFLVPNLQKNKPTIVGPGSEDIITTDIDRDKRGSDSGEIAGLKTVFFALDSSELNSETKETLKQNISWLNNNPQVIRLELEGHCDPLGSEAYNIGLGQRRSESVKSYLLNLGIAREKLSVISYGEELFSRENMKYPQFFVSAHLKTRFVLHGEYANPLKISLLLLYDLFVFHLFPESSSQSNSTERVLEKRFCQDSIYTRKYLDFSMNFQAV